MGKQNRRNSFSFFFIESILVTHEYVYIYKYISINFFLVTFRNTRINSPLPPGDTLLRDRVHEFYDIRLLGRFLTRVPRGQDIRRQIHKKKKERRGSWPRFAVQETRLERWTMFSTFPATRFYCDTVVISLRSPHYLPYPSWKDFILEKGSVVETLGEIRSSSRPACIFGFSRNSPPVIRGILTPSRVLISIRKI